MQSIEKQIERSIKSKARGSLVLPNDYFTFGSSDAIRKALDRLEDKKVIVRVAHGIYVRPKIRKLIGPLAPSAEEEKKIVSLLKKEAEKDLKNDIRLAPVWVQKIMEKALTDGKD